MILRSLPGLRLRTPRATVAVCGSPTCLLSCVRHVCHQAVTTCDSLHSAMWYWAHRSDGEEPTPSLATPRRRRGADAVTGHPTHTLSQSQSFFKFYLKVLHHIMILSHPNTRLWLDGLIKILICTSFQV